MLYSTTLRPERVDLSILIEKEINHLEMFGQNKHHTFGYVTCLVVLILEICATQIIIEFDEKAAYILCAICAALSLLWHHSTGADTAAHFACMSLVTWYQLYFIDESVHVHAEWWLETAMICVVTLIYLVDYYLTLIVVSPEASCPHDFREGYGYAVDALLLGLAFIPLHDAGLFHLTEPAYVAGFSVVWPLLVYTESQRRISKGLEVCLPHSSLKCLPLFSLPQKYLPFFVLVVAINLLRPPTSLKRAHAEAANLDKKAEEIALGGTSRVIQRAAANGMIHKHDQEGAGDDDGHFEVEMNAYEYRGDDVGGTHDENSK
jgi:hypothetical protein